jgi:two-component system sensor histidine kinase YesM
MVDEGLIRISVNVVDGKLLYQVSDNGLGMTPEILDKLLVSETKSKAGSGVGVKNVHERIQLSYGKEYGLEIKSELEEGTLVKIWLPLIKE